MTHTTYGGKRKDTSVGELNRMTYSQNSCTTTTAEKLLGVLFSNSLCHTSLDNVFNYVSFFPLKPLLLASLSLGFSLTYMLGNNTKQMRYYLL